ncbi:hypothetical protein SLS53_000712 [Cytospora paraplurivora]|uniref:Major facilitator superfamily (MFS) profile domain-containing protein n=1 Tax=Cytospora paraplurivora TaxID=2898453 RepID=A0AAN9ULH0_9PEZI
MFLAYRWARKRYQERQNRGDNPSSATTKEHDSKSRKPVRTLEDKAERHHRRVHRWKLILGLFAPFMLQSLDTTIIASALPFIAADFNQLSQLNWIISVFNLTSAAFLPFWAQTADIFGRQTTLYTTIFLTAVGSAICTAAPTYAFGALLLGRAVQGVGAAGVNICVRIVLADRVSLADYARNWTLFALVSAVGFSIGPVIGGYLTQVSWRWCFAINLPVALLAAVLVVVFLRKELLGPQPLPGLEERGPHAERRTRYLARLSAFDYVGQLLFLFGLGLLILAFTWAGGTYGWGSAAVLVPLAVGAILSFAWIFYEYLMESPRLMSRVFPLQRAMVPWELFAKRDISLLFFVNFGLGMAEFAVMYFMDLYFALVQGQSASEAGTALLYFLPGLGSITVLAWAIKAQNTSVIYGMMALTGHGVGIRLSPATMHGLAYFPSNTSAITCIFSLAVPFGGMIALTMMSTVFNNKSETTDKSAIMWAFVALIPFMWLCVLLTTFLGNVWVHKGGDHDVVNGAYLWSFLTPKRLLKEKRTREGSGWDGVLVRTDTQMVVTGEARKAGGPGESV